MNNSGWRNIDVRVIAVLASFISSGLLRISPASLNDDAYVYIHTAEIFLDQGLQAALTHYSWPLFSILIALTSKLGLSLISSAFLINSLFFALLCFAFVSIIRTIDPNPKTLGIATVCILVFPELADYRSMIIRDIGFWSLCCVSVWQLLIFSKTQRISYGIGFSITLLLAAGFRIEALIYLLALPPILAFCCPEKITKAAFLKLLVANFSSLFAILLLLLSAGINPVAQIAEFGSTYEPFLTNLLNTNTEQSSAIAVSVFGEYAATYSQEYLWLFLTTGLFSLLVASLITGIGPPILIIAIAWLNKTRLRIDPPILFTLLAYMAVNFFIVAAFIFLTRFLPSRYTMLFAIMVLVLVVLVVCELLKPAQLKKHNVLGFTLAFMLVYCTVGSYYSFGNKKTYIPSSIAWIEEQNFDNIDLLSNHHGIAYHSGQIENYDRIDRNLRRTEILSLGEAGWLAVEMNREMKTLMAELVNSNQIEFIQGFPNTGLPKIAIYKRSP